MSRGGKLAPEVNRALFYCFSGLSLLLLTRTSYNVTPEDLFDLFGKFGPVRQIRQGIANNTKGTAFVVYEDVMDAKQACDKLNGFNFQNRYLVVLYHQPEKMAKSKEDLAERQENLEKLKKQHGID
ncbi:MAG: hypothetical protein ASARMPREDX12_001500 [Alectoria sarmentosa]|nr:MAG: hypothetical protein ASARMPREDX12_001500 [Alectoria sarmentosa]